MAKKKIEENTQDVEVQHIVNKYSKALVTHRQRIKQFPLYALVASGKNVYDYFHNPNKKQKKQDAFSEGTSQAVKRKSLNDILQRVPDGEINSIYDVDDWQYHILNGLLNEKCLSGLYNGTSFFNYLLKAATSSWDFGFDCTLQEFETDLTGDLHIVPRHIAYNDILPDPNAKHIEDADWYIVRDYVDHRILFQQICDCGKCECCKVNVAKDSTYDLDTLKWLKENNIKSDSMPELMSLKSEDIQQGIIPQNSKLLEVLTFYQRGADEFVSVLRHHNKVLRRVKNYHPNKEVPLFFLILDPDSEYPYGVSQVSLTFSKQMFADAYQTTAYNQLLLDANKPIVTWGLQNLPPLKMLPGANWAFTDPQRQPMPQLMQTSVSALNGYGNVLQQVSQSMKTQLGQIDGTLGSDGYSPSYSKTHEGVVMQNKDRTAQTNRFQKQIESFISEYLTYAITSYVIAQKGFKKIALPNDVLQKANDAISARNKLSDVKAPVLPYFPNDGLEVDYHELLSYDDDGKIGIDFTEIKVPSSFLCRAGSMIQSLKDEELDTLNRTLVSVSQSLGAFQDGKNKQHMEQICADLTNRILKLSNIEIAQQTAQNIFTEEDREYMASSIVELKQLKEEFEAYKQQEEELRAQQEQEHQQPQAEEAQAPEMM